MIPDRLAHYLHAWNLSDPQPLTQTPTSHVYTVQYNGSRAVLKLLTPVGVHDEHHGAMALQRFDGHGAVRLLHHAEDAHLLEYIDGGDLVPVVRRGEDEQSTVIIAGVLNQLHAATLDAPAKGLLPLRRRFDSLFLRAEVDRKAGTESLFVRGARVAEQLLAEPRDRRVLHGDMHHANVRHHVARGWLAFDPKGLYGERTFDAANTLCNPVALPERVTDAARLLRQAAILAEHLGVDYARLRRFTFAYACLSAAWSLEDGHAASLALRVAEITGTQVNAD